MAPTAVVRAGAATLAALVAALVSGCGEADSPAPSPVSSPTRPGAATAAVDCADAIDRRARALPELTDIDGQVALPADWRLGTSRDPGAPAVARLFAKQGLLVRSGSRVELSLPDGLRSHAAIGWGNPGQPAAVVRVSCPAVPGRPWLVFAGGYWVDRPQCLPVRVQTSTGTTTVRIGVGVSCP